MNRPLSFATACLLAAAMPCAAQVQVDRAIVLTGADESARQVLGLASDTVDSAPLRAGMAQSGAYRTGIAAEATPYWAIAPPGWSGPPVAGSEVVLLPLVPAVDPPALVIAGHGPYPVTMRGSAPLDTALYPAGTILSLVFDGSSFQVLNPPPALLPGCPTEMAAAPGGFCIDTEESAPMDFPSAALHCGTQGKRLCSWGEFHAACNERVALGLQAMLGNWEWTSSTADSNFFVRTAGQSTCESASRFNGTTTLRAFRCCFTR